MNSNITRRAGLGRLILPPDIMLFLALLIGCNLHLAVGTSCQALIFDYQQALAGEVYRLLTHPFTHLSWYHLLLDGGAFILLYTGLREQRPGRKLLIVACCAAGALIMPLLFSHMIYQHGLCGLSGIAHGLMAFTGLEMLQVKRTRRIGGLCLAVVIGKSLWESAAGDVIFSSLQFGLCGIPNALCHAGGVIGAIVAYLGFEIGEIGGKS